MRISSTKDVESRGVKALIYGDSGLGKTTLAGTLTEPTLILSFEGGLLSLKDKDIDVLDCTIDDDGKMLDDTQRIEKLAQAFKWLEEPEQKARYANIFVDSLTDVADTMVKALEKKHANSTNKFAVWGDLAKNMEGIVRKFRNYPGYNIFFTALEEETTLESAIFYQPRFPGKVTGPKVMAAFDEVFRLTADKDGKRMLMCQPTINVKAKERSGSLLPIEEPNLQIIVDKIKEEKLQNE